MSHNTQHLDPCQHGTQPDERSEGSGGGCCAATASSASSLPCLSSNNAIDKIDYIRKQAHCLRENIARFISEIGICFVGFLSLTFEENLVDHKLAYARFNSLNNNYLKKSPFFGGWYCVKERQERGAWHYHLLIQVFQDIRTGFDWDLFAQGNYTQAPPHLRQIWKDLRTMLPRYGFGRHELTPVRTNIEGISHYMAKYLYKGFHYRQPQDKGVKLYTSSRQNISSTPKFMWITENSRKWRNNCDTMTKVFLQGDSDIDMVNHFGKRWAYHMRSVIVNLDKYLNKEQIPF